MSGVDMTASSVVITGTANAVDFTGAGGLTVDAGATGTAITGAVSSVGLIKTSSTTDASSSTTGALQSAGGLGVKKKAHVGGNLDVRGAATLVGHIVSYGGFTETAGTLLASDTTDATSSTTG